MRKIPLEQGSEAWLNWRKSLLTATDAAMLMGRSPYCTPFKGWQRKIGDAPEQVVTSAMLRGQDDEPRARAMFIKQYGIHMTPCCIESELYNYLGASLDGISDCGRYILEIKSQPIERVKAEGIPEFHLDQMQEQLLCTDNIAEMCFYCTIWGDEIYVLEVYPDTKWKENFIPQAKEFWKLCVFKEPPALTNKDYKEMNDNATWNSFATEYAKLAIQIKELEDIKDRYKEELIKLSGGDSCMGAGIKLMKKFIKGRIDYKEACDVLNVRDDQLEQFRKKGSESWAITLDSK